jgi:TolB-like protein/DNA-binding winged helix-turn-helix (wHTH) protein/Tfp pilus assembly protein PilF
MQQPIRAEPPGTVAYVVGDLVVDTARAQVTRDGVELPLPKLSFDLLVALIEASPSVLSLDALMDRVWAGVVVSPETVSQRAKLLRDALGDDSRAPRYFTSVRGRGYRLVADVVPLAPAVVGSAAPETLTPTVATAAPSNADVSPSETIRRTARWRVPLLVAVVAVLALGAWLLTGRDEANVAPTKPASAPQAIDERSIAVLPFKSLGAKEDGDVLAFGIAEAVLHQLANVQGLVVIARASSFALGAEPGDARNVGRTLNVRYMLEGSVQQAEGLLRVTAQLIDTRTGAHVWSIRFDKPSGDIFAMQDDIAAQVAKALQLSVSADTATRMAGQGTTRFEAYLAYLQGRALLATGRVGDSERAIARFEEAERLDPRFAAAIVSRAEAELFAAEFGGVEGRAERFERAGRNAADAIERALALDPRFGPAHLLRGYLEAFADLGKAEASYRRGLELRPNDARGYAGLAAILFERPEKRDEALQLLDRARRLDPLEPAHDVTKSVFLLYDRGDVRAADALLFGVLQRQPQFVPALIRRGELAWCCGADASTAVELLERALAIDPEAQWARRSLVRAYLDVGDVHAAKAVIADAGGAKTVLQVSALSYAGEWRLAGEAAYVALELGTVTPLDELAVVVSIRRHARLTGQFDRAITALEKRSSVSWQQEGSPRVPHRPGLRVTSIGLADMLQAGGHPARARLLIDRLLAQMSTELRVPGRMDTWYCHGMSVALALRGEPELALDWLRRGVEIGSLAHDEWLTLGGDPAFDGMRNLPQFQRLLHEVHAVRDREMAELAQLRAAGRVPRRH